MFAMVKKLWNDESGQGLVEYALIIALVSVLLVAALSAMQVSISDVFGRITGTLETA